MSLIQESVFRVLVGVEKTEVSLTKKVLMVTIIEEALLAVTREIIRFY